jgi:hypothetical protein
MRRKLREDNVNIQLRYSESLCALPWSVSLGVVTLGGVDSGKLQSALATLSQSFFSDDGLSGPVTRRTELFESFFAASGFRSPLGGQLQTMRRKKTLPGPPLVQALLLSEMTSGLLMGAQDAAAIKGDLLCELAEEGETFRGMRSEVRCREGEIVLRDSEGIIASLLQGPDYRTRLNSDTRDVAFFVFSAPGIGSNDVQEGIEAVRTLFQPVSDEINAKLFLPADCRL